MQVRLHLRTTCVLTREVSHEHIVHHQKSAGNYANSVPALDKNAGTYIGSDTRRVPHK